MRFVDAFLLNLILLTTQRRSLVCFNTRRGYFKYLIMYIKFHSASTEVDVSNNYVSSSEFVAPDMKVRIFLKTMRRRCMLFLVHFCALRERGHALHRLFGLYRVQFIKEYLKFLSLYKFQNRKLVFTTLVFIQTFVEFVNWSFRPNFIKKNEIKESFERIAKFKHITFSLIKLH